MATLTEEAKKIMARIYSREDLTTSTGSKTLPEPRFIEQKSNLTYISDIESNLGVVGFTILDIIDYQDYKIVFGNYDNNNNGAIGIFSVNDDSFIWAFNQTEELNTIELLKPFKFVNVTKTGSLVGLQNYGSTVHFFRFTDFLPDLQDFIDGTDTIFFDANFDIGTVISKDTDGTTDLDPKLGNARFLDYEKIGFNQDNVDNNIFAFVLWSSYDDIMYFVRFSVDASEINSIRDVQFSFNEPVNLSQGDDLPGSDLSDVSIAGVLTGETYSNGATTYGSIIFSTEKDGASNIRIPFGPLKIKSASDHLTTPTPIGGKYSAPENFKRQTVTLIGNSEMQALFQYVRDYLNNNSSIIDSVVGLKMDIKSGWGTQPDHPTSTDTLTITNEMLNATNITITREIYVSPTVATSNSFGRITGDTELYIDVTNRLEYDGKHATIGSDTAYESEDGLAQSIRAVAVGTLVDANTPLQNSGQNWNASILEDMTLTTLVSGNILQATTKANTTSQIVISRDSNNNSVYNIYQSENDSYQGTKPVFLSPLKAYIPLKKTDTNNYSVFEFNGTISQNAPQRKAFRNSAAPGDGQVLLELLSPISIDNVYVEEAVISTSRYSLSGNTITIDGMVKDQQIRVEYQTKVGEPKLINVSTSTTSSDFFIAGVATVDEVESNTPSIVGAGDDFVSSATKDNELLASTGLGLITTFTAPINEIITEAEDGYDVTKVIATDKKSVTYTGTVPLGPTPPVFSRVIIKTSNLPSQVFGMNLYRQYSSDFDAIIENTQQLDFKVAHVRGYRQKDLLWIEAYNADFSSYVKWVQIYPESFKPYTYLPYRNTLLELELERLNSNIDGQLNLSAFDRALLNISTSNNITIATTTAENTDLNSNNNLIQLYGQTNQAIIEEKRTITKTRNISTEINVNITTGWVDKSDGGEILRVEPSNEMAKLFNPHELENRDENHIDNFKLFDENGVVVASGSTLPYLSRVDGSVFFKADFVSSTTPKKVLDKIEIYNGVGQLLSSETLPTDCDGIISYSKEFRFTDRQSEIQYFTWGKTPWGTKPWQPVTTTKGGK